jgi:hypothetical protein
MELITALIHIVETTRDLYSSAHQSDSAFYCHSAVISWRKPAKFVRCNAEKGRAGESSGDQNSFLK